MSVIEATPYVRTTAPDEELDIYERQLADRLRGCSLVTELEVEHLAPQVARLLGRVYAKWSRRGYLPSIPAQWPACVLVALSGTATTAYRGGELWPQLWQALGLPDGTARRSFWAEAFRTAAHRLHVPDFPDSVLRQIGPILMHAGIPNYCLNDYLRLVAHRRSVDGALSAEDFLTWSRMHAGRLNSLDVPAQRFLESGSEYAADFVDRTFDLLDRVQAGSVDFDSIALPQRVVDRARALAAANKLDLVNQKQSQPVRSANVSIALDPFGDGIQLVLPKPADIDADEVCWLITTDGLHHVLRSPSPWPGVAETPPPATFVLDRPVRTVVARADESQLSTELAVVDPADPLLVFNESGDLLLPRAPIPPGAVWMLYPEDRELVADQTLRVIGEELLPPGWQGWRLQQVAIADCSYIGLSGKLAVRRQVRGHIKPRLDNAEPLNGVHTPYGNAVYAQLPDVWLPAPVGGMTTWAVEIRRVDNGAVVGHWKGTIDGATVVDRLWDELPRPVLGAFDVIARGPLGSGLRRSVFVAEGLDVSYLPAIRRLEGTGLVAGRAEFSTAIGGTVEPRVVEFGAQERQQLLEYRTPTETEPLIVTPPHIQVRHERADGSPGFSAGTIIIHSDELSAAHSVGSPGTLMVRGQPGCAAGVLHVLSSGCELQQVPASGRCASGTARYDLARIADTVREYPTAELVVVIDNVPTRVASIRPRRLAKGVAQAGKDLRLIDPAAITGLTAGVYAKTAPWRGVTVIPVADDGRVPLPEDLHRAGTLVVVLQVEDPWVPVCWPDWPQQAFVVRAGGHVRGTNDAESELGRFVAGNGPFPERPCDLGQVWQVFDLLPRLSPVEHVPSMRALCAEALSVHPAASLMALSTLRWPPERVIAAVVSAGLAAEPLAEVDPRWVRRQWPVAPVLAALGGQLADLDCRAAAAVECGTALEAIRESAGPDPYAQVGRFGPESIRLRDMTPLQLEGLWRAAQVVPSAMLDGDSRLTAARRLFDRRDEPAIRHIAGRASDLLSRYRPLIAQHPRLLAQLAAREPGRGTDRLCLVPLLSALFAMVSRLAARGDEHCRAAALKLRDDWLILAEAAPELVAIDLVLAEFLLTDWSMPS